MWYSFALLTIGYFLFKCATLRKHLERHDKFTSDAVIHVLFTTIYLIFTGIHISILIKPEKLLFFNNQMVFLEKEFSG